MKYDGRGSLKKQPALKISKCRLLFCALYSKFNYPK